MFARSTFRRKHLLPCVDHRRPERCLMGHHLGSTCIGIAIHWGPPSNTKVFQCSIDNRSFSFRVSCHHHFFIQNVVMGKRVSTSAPNLATLSSSIRCHYQPPEVLSGRLVCFHIVVSSLSTPHTPHPTRWRGGVGAQGLSGCVCQVDRQVPGLSSYAANGASRQKKHSKKKVSLGQAPGLKSGDSELEASSTRGF